MCGMDTSTAPTTDREFIHSRLIDAPPERCFQAFADPARLARWWGPKGFTSSFETFEFRIGGAWRFVLHGPDGIEYPNENVIADIDPPGRIVVEHLSQPHHFFLTITFAPEGDKTRVGWRQVFDSAEESARVAGVVVPANEENLDRLAAEVGRVG
jgi:uncharacterized protein YndB with AHSA1/START domain